MQKLLIIAAFIFLAPATVSAQANAGFVDTTIWFSNAPDVVGETTMVSTLVNNQEDKAVYGTVGFYDNDKQFGQKTVTIEPHASKVVTVSWKVTAGSHSFVAKFQDTRFGSEKGTTTRVTGSQSSPNRFSVAGATTKTDTTKTDAAKTDSATNDGSESKTEQAVGDVKNAAENTFQSFDGFRDDTAVTLEKKVDTSKKEVATAKSEKNDSALKTPFAYLKLYFYQMAHFIFSHMYVFYGLIILIIILFVRYLIRAPR